MPKFVKVANMGLFSTVAAAPRQTQTPVLRHGTLATGFNIVIVHLVGRRSVKVAQISYHPPKKFFFFK